LTEPPLAILSIPDRFEIDSPIVARHVQERDVPIVAPAFRDPGIGGENGMPPFDEGELRIILRERMPEMRARGVLVPYVEGIKHRFLRRRGGRVDATLFSRLADD
jgi:hypothetical protein